MKKNGKPKRLPAIVPRFIKNAVAIGTIPALASTGCHPRPHPVVATYQRNAPVVAYYAPPAPIDAGPPVQPVVAMMMPPVVAAVMPQPAPPPADAGVDAAPPAKTKPAKPPKATKPPKAAKQPPPPPNPDILGVAAMFAPAPNQQLIPEDVGTPRKAKKP